MPGIRAFVDGVVFYTVINSVDYLWIKPERVPLHVWQAASPRVIAGPRSLLAPHRMVAGDGDPVEGVHGDRQPADSRELFGGEMPPGVALLALP